jgi:holo-[acyl-carrier protein] synthase
MTAPTGAGFAPCVRGLGVDAVDVERFRRVLERRPTFAGRVFTGSEIDDVEQAADNGGRLAARFAAKEAVMKALGVGIGEMDFKDVEVRRSAGGAPHIVLGGRAAELARDRGVSGWHISLTHTDIVAIASVVALGAHTEAAGPGGAET